MLRELVAPYTLWIKLGAVAVVLAIGVRGGCSWQASRGRAEVSALRADVKAKDAALGSAAAALRGSAAALKEVNAEAARRIAVADREAAALAEAGKVAQEAKAAAERRAAQLADQIEESKRKRPACAALLQSNVEAVCGISPR